MLSEIQTELKRVAAREIIVALDDDFEPQAGTLVRVEFDQAFWHLLPEQLLELLRGLPDGAGPQDVHRVIESEAVGVWHGPSPRDSRDTSS